MVRGLNTKKVLNKDEVKIVEPMQEEQNIHEEAKAPLMFTVEETARKSGLSTYTIRTWLKTGQLAHIRIGKKYLISWENFCRFLNSDMGCSMSNEE